MSKRWTSFMSAVVVAVIATFPLANAGNILINHQGRLTDGGSPVPNGSYSITVRIFDQEVGGTELYSETHNANVVDGLFNIHIGSVTPLSTDILTCDPAMSSLCPRYLEIQIASAPPMTPRTRLVAGGFSVRAIDRIPFDFRRCSITVSAIPPGRYARATSAAQSEHNSDNCSRRNQAEPRRCQRTARRLFTGGLSEWHSMR